MRRERFQVSSNYKILLVDDEQGILDSLSVVLKKSGYHYTGLTSPLEAIDRVRNEHFDLLILDFLMSPIHGDEVVRQIREFNREIYILPVSYTHLRAHETRHDLVCRLLLEKKKNKQSNKN